MKTIIFRLKPGSDLKKSIQDKVNENSIKAGYIISCVGGLEKVTVRMAGAQPDNQDIRVYEDKYEIVSLVGTISQKGMHLHLSFSDKEGRVIGGHLKDGNIVNPTAEIVIGYESDREFERHHDSETGFPELVVKSLD